MAGSPASVETLHSDITSLIETAKKRFAENPFDEEEQKRLKALLDLQGIIQTQQLPTAQLAMVKDQLYKLANPTPPLPQISVQPLPAAPVSLPLQAPSLAHLFAGQLNQFVPTPPAPISQIPQVIPQPTPPPPPQQPTVPTVGDAASLFASLQSAGLLPGLGIGVGRGIAGLNLASPPSKLPQTVIPQANPTFLRSIVSTPAAQTPPPPPAGSKWKSIDVELKTASLKM